MLTMILAWLKALTPRNIIIVLVVLLILGLLFKCWQLQGSLTKTEGDLSTSQRNLAATKLSLSECARNRADVIAQYNQAAKVTQGTNEIRERIIKIRELVPQDITPGSFDAGEIEKEPIDEGKYLKAVIDTSNDLFARFHAGVQP